MANDFIISGRVLCFIAKRNRLEAFLFAAKDEPRNGSLISPSSPSTGLDCLASTTLVSLSTGFDFCRSCKMIQYCEKYLLWSRSEMRKLFLPEVKWITSRNAILAKSFWDESRFDWVDWIQFVADYFIRMSLFAARTRAYDIERLSVCVNPDFRSRKLRDIVNKI